MAKLLIVEDDAAIADQLTAWFREQGYVCEAASSGEDGMQLLSSFNYDLIVLDWNLPGMSGLDVCRQFRKNGGQTPILFLTAQSDINYKESGLDSGADDFLIKPFEIRELAARVRSLLRRPAAVLSEKLQVNGVQLEVSTRTVYSGAKQIQLMPTECSLLEYMMKHPDTHYSAKQLLTAIWSSESEGSEDSVRTCMKTLRFKLAKIGMDDFVKTNRGFGYVVQSRS